MTVVNFDIAEHKPPRKQPLRIDTQIRQWIPSMTEAERETLKTSIQFQGRVMQPITVWKERGVVIDGCNRFELATELGLPFEVQEISFPDDDTAMRWRIDSALAHRNLNIGSPTAI